MDPECQARVLSHVWGMSVGHSSSFGLKSIVKLRIPDILVEAGCPMSLESIASRLAGSSIQLGALGRLMDFMCSWEVFDVEDSGEQRLYKYNDNTVMCTMASFGGLLQIQDELITSGWHHIPDYILHGGPHPFERAQGMNMLQLMGENTKFCQAFCQAMAAMSSVIMNSVLEHYHGFKDIPETLVDVGGSLGKDLERILAAHPRIKGINLELPTLTSIAPEIPGVRHVSGDMFQSIPAADAAMFKAVLHSFTDEQAVVALKNCYEVLPSGGKVMIVDIVMDPQGGPFDKIKYAFDSVLLALTSGGRERSTAQWKQLLTASSFERFSVVHIPHCLHAVVEAHKP